MSKHSVILNLKDGHIENRKDATVFFRSLKDGKYLLEINALNKRSNPQNRYYWGLMIPLVQKGIEDLGTELTKDETHEFLKARFNYSELVNHETGEVIPVPISTAKLNKEQFSEYIEKIQRFAAEWLQIEIPDPGVQTMIDV